MKTLKYTYWLLSVLLSCVVMLSCDEDDETENIKDETEDVLYSEGDTITTDITIGVSVPAVDVSAEVTTRAVNINNADTSEANLENVGKFQNLIIFIIDHEGRLRGIHRKEFGTATDNYTWVFRSVKGVAGKEFKAYAFGNVPTEDFDGYWGKLESKVTEQVTISRLSDKLSVDNVYNINFEVGKQTYKINGTPMTSTGMPMNNVASFEIKKGNNEVSIAMKRVCARLEIKVHNGKSNPIYVDKLKLTNCLVSNTGYFTGYSVSPTYVEFDIDKFVSSEQGHHTVESNNDMTLAFYVFEGNSEYTYDVKIDRGKNLKKVTVPEDGNVYALWCDGTKRVKTGWVSYVQDWPIWMAHNSNNNEIYPYNRSSKLSSTAIPSSAQILWYFEKTGDEFYLQAVNLNYSNDVITTTNKYFYAKSKVEGDITSLDNKNNANKVSLKYSDKYKKCCIILTTSPGMEYRLNSNSPTLKLTDTSLNINVLGISTVLNESERWSWSLYEKYLNQTGSKTLKKERNKKYEIKFDVK